MANRRRPGDAKKGDASFSYEFVVCLKDRDDSEGLARLLKDVLLPGVTSQMASFTAPQKSAVELLLELQADQENNAGESHKVLVLEQDETIAPLIPGHGWLVLLGTPKELTLDSVPGLANVATFPVSGPLDFAVQVMERFSGPNERAQFFDHQEAARMRALADDFPLDFASEEEDGEHDDLFSKGQQLWRKGELTEALTAYGEAIAREPDRSELQVSRGYVLKDLAWQQRDQHVGDWINTLEEAKRAFRTALDLDFPVPGEVGDALFDLEDYSAAVKAYRLALNLEDSSRIHSSLGSALTLDEHVDHRFELALDEYTNALRLAPDNTTALKSRAIVRLYLCQYDEALTDSQAAEKRGDDAAGMFFYRALIYSALGDLHQARKCATRAMNDATEEDRTPWFAYVYAHITADLGDLDEAIQALERAEALAMDPDDNDLLAKVDGLRGLVLARMGQFDRARVSCESSLTRSTNAAEPYATLAWICMQTGRAEEASVRIEQAISSIEKSTTWQNDCQYKGSKWPFYLLQAAILNAVAEQYDDLRAAEGALAAADNAQSDRDKDGRKQSEQNDERAAQIFLERARSHALCKEHQQVPADLNECLKLAPKNSRASYAATRALRYAANRNLEIDARLIALVDALLLAGVVALFLTSKLTSGALAAIILGVLGLGLAAFCLPVITEMRIGTLQLNKTVAAAIATPLPKLDTPLPGVRLPALPKLRSSLPSIISQMRPRPPGT